MPATRDRITRDRIVRDTGRTSRLTPAQMLAARKNDFKGLNKDYPVLMLPVRMETRFLPAGNPTSLKVRIFPDHIFMQDHAEKLTKAEYELGQKFWADLKPFTGKKDYDDHRKEAWKWLTTKLGLQRALYVADKTKNGQLRANQLRDNETVTPLRSPVLPNYWFVVGYKGGERVLEVVSKSIDPDLSFSPDFANLPDNVSNDLAIDPAVKWMFDFNEAKNKGMAVQVTLNNKTRDGFDDLYVVGIRTKGKGRKISPQQAAQTFESLLESHYYEEGAGFVPQGMPTNNTEEISSGWSAFSQDIEMAWARHFENKKYQGDVSQQVAGALTPLKDADKGIAPADQNDGVLAAALGLSADSIMGRFEYSEGFEQKAMKAMNTALWPVTMGEYLHSLLPGKSKRFMSDANKNWMKSWTKNHVYGGAPLPSLRIGESPYGILPLQATSHMNAKDVREKKMLALLNTGRSYWDDRANRAEQLTQTDQGSGEVGDTLMTILSQQPHPVGFTTQNISYARGFILFGFKLIKMAVLDKRYSQAAPVLETYSTADFDELYTKKHKTATMERATYYILRAQFKSKVKTAKSNSDKSHLEFGIKHLGMLIDILDDHIMRLKGLSKIAPGPIEDSLHDDIDDPAVGYSRYSADSSDFPDDILISVSAMDAEDKTRRIHARDYLPYLREYAYSFYKDNVKVRPNPLNGKEKPLLYQLIWMAILNTHHNNASSRKSDLLVMMRALDVLVKFPDDQLYLLMQQTLGLFCWRLDAWFSSLHNKRLHDLRRPADKKAGIQIGAFGWVEDLKPRHAEFDNAALSDGYIHTPSLNHAKTAAVLRSGYLSYQDENTKNSDLFTVDLSSERMRLAGWIFDAIRQGHDLADILGYHFERRLHKYNLDHWIYPIRQTVLAHAQDKEDPKLPVVDGLELFQLWSQDTEHRRFQKFFKEYLRRNKVTSSFNFNHINPHIAYIGSVIDSLSDVTITDSVHALVQGNTLRAGASLAAIGRADIPPPEMNVLKTQRTGKTITQRVMMIAPRGYRDGQWHDDLDIRQKNLWMGLLPDIDALFSAMAGSDKNLTFSYYYHAVDGDKKSKAKAISLYDMAKKDSRFALGALDVFSLLPLDDNSQENLLYNWIILFLERHRLKNIAPDMKVIIDTADPVTQDSLLRLMQWRDLYQRNRALKKEDLIFDPNDTDVHKDKSLLSKEAVEQCHERLTGLEQIIKSYLEAMNIGDIFFESDDKMLAFFDDILLSCGRFNLIPHIPTIRTNIDADARMKQLAKFLLPVRTAIAQRLKAVQKEGLSRVKQATIIMGKDVAGFRAITMGKQQANSFVDCLSRPLAKYLDHEGECYSWLEKMQYVRPHLRDLSETLLTQSLDVAQGDTSRFAIAQFPDVPGERWAATHKPEKTPGHVYSVLSVLPAKLNSKDLDGRELVGVLIDEIVERIPETEEDTGVALHFDSPNAEPPQAMLLAMAPEGKSWNFDLMIETLKEMTRWTKMRSLDGENIKDLDQHIPMIFAGSNLSVPDREEK